VERPLAGEPVFLPEPDAPAASRHVITPLRAAVACLLVGVSGFFVLDGCRRSDVESRAGAVASELAGRAVSVSCPGPISRVLVYEVNAGWVDYGVDGPADETRLTAEPCDGLRRLIAEGDRLELRCLETDSCSREDREVAIGVAVLAHEAAHLKGIVDEGAAECFSHQNSAWTAERLGASPDDAARIPVWQRDFQSALMPDRYRTSC
jgi:hypothetical protein